AAVGAGGRPPAPSVWAAAREWAGRLLTASARAVSVRQNPISKRRNPYARRRQDDPARGRDRAAHPGGGRRARPGRFRLPAGAQAYPGRLLQLRGRLLL